LDNIGVSSTGELLSGTTTKVKQTRVGWRKSISALAKLFSPTLGYLLPLVGIKTAVLAVYSHPG
jgi:hypothetical protein